MIQLLSVFLRLQSNLKYRLHRIKLWPTLVKEKYESANFLVISVPSRW